MKHIQQFRKKIWRGAIVLIIIVMITIPTIIVTRAIVYNESKSDAYDDLSLLAPEVVIHYQEVRLDSWKDYVAVIQVWNMTDNDQSYKESIDSTTSHLVQQLDNGINFNNLDWSGLNIEAIKQAKYCRHLLDQYLFFTPGEYQFPLQEPSHYTDTFGADREGGQRKHEGTDIFNQKGTPIFSVCNGTLERIGWNRLGGERVGIRGQDGNYYYYAHLEKVNEALLVGNSISKGELIGTMGNTGDAITTPDHLHFGIELPNGKWINPYSWLKVWEFNSRLNR